MMTIVYVTIVQSLARKRFAQKLVDQLRWQIMSDAATTISSVWRGFAYSREYIFTIAGMSPHIRTLLLLLL